MRLANALPVLPTAQPPLPTFGSRFCRNNPVDEIGEDLLACSRKYGADTGIEAILRSLVSGNHFELALLLMTYLKDIQHQPRKMKAIDVAMTGDVGDPSQWPHGVRGFLAHRLAGHSLTHVPPWAFENGVDTEAAAILGRPDGSPLRITLMR